MCSSPSVAQRDGRRVRLISLAAREIRRAERKRLREKNRPAKPRRRSRAVPSSGTDSTGEADSAKPMLGNNGTTSMRRKTHCAMASLPRSVEDCTRSMTQYNESQPASGRCECALSSHSALLAMVKVFELRPRAGPRTTLGKPRNSGSFSVSQLGDGVDIHTETCRGNTGRLAAAY